MKLTSRLGIGAAVVVVAAVGGCQLFFPTDGLDNGPVEDAGVDVSADVEPLDDGGIADGCTDAAPNRCGTACVDTKTDPQNCGGCGVACKETNCKAGACIPVIIGSDVSTAENVVVDATHVYWLVPAVGNSTIYRVRLDAITTDGGVPSPEAVLSVPNTDAGASATQFLANSSTLFWRLGRQVFAVPKANPTASPVVVAQANPSGDTLHDYDVDDTWVYSVRRQTPSTLVNAWRSSVTGAPDGGPPTMQRIGDIGTAPGAPGVVGHVGTDMLFFRDLGTANGQLLRAVGASTWDGLDASVLIKAVTSNDQYRPGGMTSDGQWLYWTAKGVMRTRVSDWIAQPALADRGSEDLSSIVVDETYVYWSSKAQGVVRRVPKDGGPPAVLARMGTGNVFLALSPQYLFWTSDGRLRALRR